MLGIPVTLDMAEECLAELVRSSTRAVRIADIERAVCTGARGRSGQPPVLLPCPPRQSSAHAGDVPGPEAYAGGPRGNRGLLRARSHSTVISAQRTVDGWIASGSRLTLADAEWGIEEAIRRVEENLRVG